MEEKDDDPEAERSFIHELLEKNYLSGMDDALTSWIYFRNYSFEGK